MTSILINVAKKLIPRSGIIKIKKLQAFFTELSLRLWVYSKWTSWLYYSIVSKAFWREQYGVIYGKLKFYENLKLGKDSNFLLRRNIHRLEKGLIMKPRRNIFAITYIENTLNLYEKALAVRDKNGTLELQWAHDVLKQYFSVVGFHPIIDPLKTKFFSFQAINGETQFVPYKRDPSILPPVNYEQFMELSIRRRSVRWYLQKPVPRELIDKAIMAATLSPSACNRQPFEFRIFDDSEMVQKVAAIPMGTAGFHHNFPAIIVVIGKLRAYVSERDRHVIYIDASLASMTFMYALETLGLSSCPINWPDLDPQESQMTSLINLEPDERVVMLISVGYYDPEGMIPYSQKKPLNQIRRYC
ncbi:nitroreductase family protein [Mastigocoleus sp. MO_188.B34]|uniref:nitroreductase family protein n=1 Tax=Mastigocoleus sp. MO_188.B34 TaxID=3036635 RepID=UPI002624D2ED|nr:nitroreductase family protein [Mastigocoleus sp. MO_188.B34]MDJ0696978.1 nitroreductase family protein [Mastigocoleus sp. MO_188.B34]